MSGEAVRTGPGRWPLCLALAFCAAALALVWWRGVSVPFYDEWIHAEVLLRWRERGLNLADLWAQYNESRKVIPRLAMIGLAWLTGHDLRWQMTISVLLCGAAAWGVGLWAARSGVAAAMVVVALLFHPMQAENWLWGIQFICFMPLAALVAVAAWEGRARRIGGQLGVGLLAVVGAAAASLSYASGLLLWPVFTLWLAWRRDWRAAAVCGVAGVTFFVAYFATYQRPTWTQPWSAALLEPVRFGDFLLVQLGLPWGLGLARWRAVTVGGEMEPVALSRCFGVAWLILAGLVVRRWRAARSLSRADDMGLLLIAYGAGCLLLTALGRSPFGLSAALPARYVTFSLPMWAGLVLLGWPRGVRLQWSMGVGVMVLWACCVPEALNRAERLNLREEQGRAEIMISPFIQVESLRSKVADRHPFLIRLAAMLTREGWLHPAMIVPSIVDAEGRATAVSANEWQLRMGEWGGFVRAIGAGTSPSGPTVAVLVAAKPELGQPALVVGAADGRLVVVLEQDAGGGPYVGPATPGVKQWYGVWTRDGSIRPLRLPQPTTRP